MTNIAPSISEHVSARPDTAAQLAAWIAARVLMPGRPRRVARMQAPGAEKYKDLPKATPFTPAMLAQHAAGRATYATTLDQDGMARSGCIEIDEGGMVALTTTMRTATVRGLMCFGIRMPPGEHDGGHVWFLYAEPAPSAAIRAQLAQLVQAAGLPSDTEIWPSKQCIRLPLGWHTRAESFGTLYTQAGEVFDLDDPAQRSAAALCMVDLATNSAPPELATTPAPARAVPMPRRVSPGEQAAERMSVADFRAQFNATHSLEDLLTGDGAERTKDGYSCPCGVDHTHATTLYISKHGKLFSHSPRCRFYSTKGYDALGYYVLTRYHNDFTAALKDLNPYAPRSSRSAPKMLEYRLSPEEQERRDAANARRREQHQAERRAHLAALEATMAQYDGIPSGTHVVAAYMFWKAEIAGSLQVNPSNAEIAAATKLSERTITDAFVDLEDLGIGVRRGGRGGAGFAHNETAMFTFADTIPRSQHALTHRDEERRKNAARARRRRKQAAQHGTCCDLIKHEHVLDHESPEHVSARPEPPQPTPVDPAAADVLRVTHEPAVPSMGYPDVHGVSNTADGAPAPEACYVPEADWTQQDVPAPVRTWSKPIRPSQYVDAHRTANDEYTSLRSDATPIRVDEPDPVSHVRNEPATMPRLAGGWRAAYRATLEGMSEQQVHAERVKQQRSAAKAERECLPWLTKAQQRLQLVYAELQRRRDAQSTTRARARTAQPAQARADAAAAAQLGLFELVAGGAGAGARSHAHGLAGAALGVAGGVQ